MKTTFVIIISFFLINLESNAQTSWYVGPSGLDQNGNGLSTASPFKTITYGADKLNPGDTLFVMAGTYTNTNFMNGDIWKTESTVRINSKNGSPGNWMTIKPYQNDKVILRGDATVIFQVRRSSYIRVEGFEMFGLVDSIPLDSAFKYQFAYRLPDSTTTLYRVPPGTPTHDIDTMTFPVINSIVRPDFFNTKGLLAQRSHHIEFVNNHVHHCPGTGLRAQVCDYMYIIGNEVNDNSRRSSVGTHGLVFDGSTDIDTFSGYKIIIEGNEVHHNYNEVYSWNATKTFIEPTLDEGKGISMQRNAPSFGWVHGRILIQNNVCYRNGFSGVHSNIGERLDFINNTCYFNSFSGRGNNIGISVSDGKDVNIINNISVAETAWGGFAISMDRNSTGVTVRNNVVFGNLDPDIDAVDVKTTLADPLFRNAVNSDFYLLAGSPAIDSADVSAAPLVDFFKVSRDAKPDIGAIEAAPSLPSCDTDAGDFPWKDD